MLSRYQTSQSSLIRFFHQMLFLSILLLSFCSIQAQSSTGNLFGKVLDSSTKDPLPGANVFIKGTSIGSTTDIEGHFRIMNIATGQYDLVVSYIGYEKKIIPIMIFDGIMVSEEVFLSFDVLNSDLILCEFSSLKVFLLISSNSSLNYFMN